MARRGKPSLVNYINYGALRAAEALLLSLPWRAARSLARGFGDLLYVLDRRPRRARMLGNIQRALPEMDGAALRVIARGAYRSLCGSLVDALHLRRIILEGRCAEFVEARGREKLTGCSRRNGLIFVTGHFGCWELMGAASASLGYPVLTIARRMSNPLTDRHIVSLRESTGETVTRRTGAMHRVVHTLRTGGNVGFLIDQDARRHGIFVEFFGRQASTISTPARLAVSTGAPVVFAYARRISNENRFRIVIDDVIEPRPGANGKEEVYRITQRATRDLENAVRQWPSEWLWMHRRWKTYPGKYPGRDSGKFNTSH